MDLGAVREMDGEGFQMKTDKLMWDLYDRESKTSPVGSMSRRKALHMRDRVEGVQTGHQPPPGGLDREPEVIPQGKR